MAVPASWLLAPGPGFGVVLNNGVRFARALAGRRQTAQRAEVAALATAPCMTSGPLVLVVDNMYVWQRAQAIQGGFQRGPHARHGDYWRVIQHLIHRLKEVRWIRSHLSPGEDWGWNDKADKAATEGQNAHREPREAQKTWNRRAALAKSVQLYIHKVHDAAEKDHLTRGRECPKGVLVKRMPRRRAVPRRDGLRDAMARHQIEVCGTHEVCVDCGRRTRVDNKRQVRFQKWREPCEPLGLFRHVAE